jgi:hypothetical protein
MFDVRIHPRIHPRLEQRPWSVPRMRFKPQNSANHLVWVEWPSKFDSLNGGDGRPRPSHLSAGWRCEWRELDSLKSKRLAIRFLRVLSGRKASHGAARPPRPTIAGNPACSTLRRFRGQTLSCETVPGASRSVPDASSPWRNSYSRNGSAELAKRALLSKTAGTANPVQLRNSNRRWTQMNADKIKNLSSSASICVHLRLKPSSLPA